MCPLKISLGFFRFKICKQVKCQRFVRISNFLYDGFESKSDVLIGWWQKKYTVNGNRIWKDFLNGFSLNSCSINLNALAMNRFMFYWKRYGLFNWQSFCLTCIIIRCLLMDPCGFLCKYKSYSRINPIGEKMPSEPYPTRNLKWKYLRISLHVPIFHLTWILLPRMICSLNHRSFTITKREEYCNKARKTSSVPLSFFKPAFPRFKYTCVGLSTVRTLWYYELLCNTIFSGAWTIAYINMVSINRKLYLN